MSYTDLPLFAYRAEPALEPPEPQPAGPARLYAFPLARRIAFVRSHAEAMLRIDLRGIDIRMSRMEKRQREVLRRKGFAEPLIDRQIADLKAAIAAEHRRLLDLEFKANAR